jgi:hypothetical protein
VESASSFHIFQALMRHQAAQRGTAVKFVSMKKKQRATPKVGAP